MAEEKASIQYQTAAGSWLNVEQLAGIDFRCELQTFLIEKLKCLV